MSNEQPPKILDLPTEHLTGNGKHYAPPKTRDSTERERRHELPAGTLLLEQQQAGIGVMLATMQGIETPTGRDYAVDMFAPSLMNAAWYQFGRDFEGMRRQVELESMVDDDGNFLTQEQRIEKLVQRLTALFEMAGRTVADHTENKTQVTRHRKLGRVMAGTATTMVSIGMGDISPTVELASVRLELRHRSQRAIRLGRTAELTLGTFPSVAQFADNISDPMVAWRRNAINEAYLAMEAAFAQAA
jgi:hypothetical protein